MQGEVLLLHRKIVKSLLVSGEYSRKKNVCIQGCKANGKIQAGCSRSKLCERCKWKSVGRKWSSEGGMKKVSGETAEWGEHMG